MPAKADLKRTVPTHLLFSCSRLYSVMSAQLIRYASCSPHFIVEYRILVHTSYCGLYTSVVPVSGQLSQGVLRPKNA